VCVVPFTHTTTNNNTLIQKYNTLQFSKVVDIDIDSSSRWDRKTKIEGKK